MQIFEVIFFFKLRTTIQQKTVKPTYLLSVRCQEAGGRKRARGSLVLFISCVFLNVFFNCHTMFWFDWTKTYRLTAFSFNRLRSLWAWNEGKVIETGIRGRGELLELQQVDSGTGGPSRYEMVNVRHPPSKTTVDVLSWTWQGRGERPRRGTGGTATITIDYRLQKQKQIWSVEKLETLPAGTKTRTQHHRLEEKGVERGVTRWTSLKERERAIVNRINTGPVSQTTERRVSPKSADARSFRDQVPLVWNSLPLKIYLCSSLSSFKSQLKTHIFLTAFPYN